MQGYLFQPFYLTDSGIFLWHVSLTFVVDLKHASLELTRADGFTVMARFGFFFGFIEKPKSSPVCFT
ncbi:MAG: hypothetical protein GY880_33500 [Planctomycetaceae bacterium]|nr:hypothetical protein [Planctomycetaceae bacterium]